MSITSSRIVPSAHAFAIDPENSFGLSLRVKGGYLLGGAAWQGVPTSTLVLADNAVNYVEVSPNGVMSTNTASFSDNAAFLYVVTTLNGVVISIADWRANPGVPGPNGVDVLKATVTLTDEQIKALPTTGVEILAAPGAGKVVVPIGVVYSANFAQAYTNIVDASPELYHVEGPGTGLSAVSAGSFLGQAGQSTWFVSGVEANSYTNGTFSGYLATVISLVPNAAIVLEDHWAAGNYEGGDPANTLTVTIVYFVADA